MVQSNSLNDNDIEWFWQIVEEVGQGEASLNDTFASLTKDEIQKFRRLFTSMSVVFHEQRFLEYVDPDESEDGVDDIADWVVSQGRDKYSAVIKQPNLMPFNADMGGRPRIPPVMHRLYWERFCEPLI